MSLGCLSCHRWLPRTDSHRCEPQQQRQQHRKLRAPPRCSRNWSGTLQVRPPKNQMKWEEDGSDHHNHPNNKAHHRRLNTLMDIREVVNTLGFDEDGGGWDEQPRLVRSCGMRRDWSFEDLIGVERSRRGVAPVGEGRNWQ